MTSEASIDNRITGFAFADRLRPFGDLPVVFRLLWNDGTDDFPLEFDSAQVSVDGKSGTDTAYGTIDVVRIQIDNEAAAPKVGLTAAQLADQMTMDLAVKFTVTDSDICFLLGSDLTIVRDDTDGTPVCLVSMIDTQDA